MSLAGSVRATFSPDIGIDLGTANTVVYSHDEGVLISEPSVVAYRTSDDAVVAIGQAAKELDGRAPGRIRVVHPLRGGTISDFRGAHALVKTVVDRALASRTRIAPRVIACVPGCATDIECKAVEEAIRAAGPRITTFVPQAVAAAVGAGLDIMGTTPRMVIDIGGGTTEIAVLVLGGVVAMHSIKIGGDTFDEAIVARLRREYFGIGPLTAERLKIERGYAGRAPGREPYSVSGTNMAALRPGKRFVDETLVGEAMADGIDKIARAAWSILEATPPDLAGELLEAGIVLTGGGALIPGFAGEIGARTNVPTTVADDPLGCVARGAGEILASPGLLERLRPHADRLTRWYQSLRIGMRESYSR
ncbi:rod shape-determining protein [Vulcanimicrobium alpinum]|uniref:Cell shape-determining protein MreB n=1 Tax=Vulcanimicrobium alpinum TaxID=3016050 RepID=A0AAN2CBM7_UNVUL|nr:rod shape-determining protein [Vulcanimicrobium alpinum]BDE08218.1 rod shape-determining protein [Vulcanimicrobium alpinum]